MATATTKKINWLFPDPDVEVTLEEYRDKICEDERSGDIQAVNRNQGLLLLRIS